MSIKFHYNAPVVLTFTIICVAVFAINSFTNGVLNPYVSLGTKFHFNSVLDYVRLFTYTFGHSSVDHLMANFAFLLLLGPVIEEKYGSQRLMIMMALTALITAILNLVFFNTGLWGASGLVFMLIMLVSFVNVKDGKIPITFILILFLYVGRELYESFAQDNISQFAHIMGGICGSLFGFTKGLKG